jgi:hypothetical protein
MDVKPAPFCFVIMPFSATENPKLRAEDWTEIFEGTFRPAAEALKYTCSRSTLRPGNFVQDILQSLNIADVVIADLTGQRSNVFYELGIRHTLRSGTVLVTQELSDIPSDLRSYGAIQYGWKTDTERQRFKADLEGHVRAIENDPSLQDSPVANFLGVQRPRQDSYFRLLPGNSNRFGASGNDSRSPGTHAHITIFNSGPFTHRVRCWFRFLREDGTEVFNEQMPGRWSSAPEPLVPVIDATNDHRVIYVPDMAKVPEGYVMDFATREEHSVAVAVCFDGHGTWGWTPESYNYDGRHPNWKLPAEPLVVEATIMANGTEYKERFHLDTSARCRDLKMTTLAANQSAQDLPLVRDIHPPTPKVPERPTSVSDS